MKAHPFVLGLACATALVTADVARASSIAAATASRSSFKVTDETDQPTVHISARAAVTREPSPTTRVRPGEFTITRLGNTDEPLDLAVEFTGTATPGQDYQVVMQPYVIPAGTNQLAVVIGPLEDSMVEGDETVIATLLPAPHYRVHPRMNSATVVIHDSDMAVVGIHATGWKTSEPCPVCLVAPGVLTFERTGPTRESLTVYLHTDGTAKAGEDYQTLPLSVTIPAGTNSTRLLVLPFDDQLVEGPEVVRVRIVHTLELAALGYVVDVHASEALVVIGDDEAGEPEAHLGPRLTLPTVAKNGAVQFVILSGSWGQTNVVEVSTDLLHWIPISTNAFPATACPICPFIVFEDRPGTNQTRRFYRAFNR